MRRLPLLRGFVNAKCISRFDYSTMPFSISFMKRTTDLLGYQWYAAKLYTVKTSRITGASDNDISLRFFVACSAARTGNNRTSTSNGNASHTFAKFTGEFLSNSKTHFKTSLQFKSAIYALPKLPRQHMPHYEPDTCPLSMHVTAVHPLILSLVSNDVGITGINYRRMASRNRFP